VGEKGSGYTRLDLPYSASLDVRQEESQHCCSKYSDIHGNLVYIQLSHSNLLDMFSVAPSTVGGTLDIFHNQHFEALPDGLPETSTVFIHIQLLI
jgi:hypothetical protein